MKLPAKIAASRARVISPNEVQMQGVVGVSSPREGCFMRHRRCIYDLCNNVADVRVAGQGMGWRSRNVVMLENR